MGFGLNFIMWIMSCIQIVSFVVLINREASPFFHAQRGLCQGCSLSPLLFFLVAKGLIHLLVEAKQRGEFQGCMVTRALPISHLSFVDDILFFSKDSPQKVALLKNILSIFGKVIGIIINFQKSTLLVSDLGATDLQ